MSNLQRVLFFTAAGLVSTGLYAQNIISAKSGMVHYLEGDVFLDDKAVELKTSMFPEIKEGQVLRTDEGRVEVLMNPGTFFRLSEHSSFKMIDKRLSATRVELLEGNAILEVAESQKDNNFTLVFKNSEIEVRKPGIYRVNGDNAELRVYKGEAVVVNSGQTLTVKEAHLTQLAGVTGSPQKFDAKMGDSFYRWAARRASATAAANLVVAKSLYDNGVRKSAFGQWYYNPFFGMFTYLPGSGMYYSPFGYSYYSPYAVGRVYNNFNNNYGGGGWANGGRSGGYDASMIDRSVGYNSSYGYSTAPRSMQTSSAPVSVAPAPSAGDAGRGSISAGDAGGGRGGASSGRGR